MDMSKYFIKVTLLSEAIFNSGEEEQNLVNEKVLTDENGFVYFHAKTLKGQLRSRGAWIAKRLEELDKEKDEDKRASTGFNESIEKLFGSEFQKTAPKRGMMTLSNLELNKEVQNYLMALNREEHEDIYYNITPYDLMEAQTNKRPRIQTQNGVAKEHMMMTYHTVKDGLVFYSQINLLEKVSQKDLVALNAVVSSMEWLGASINRGRGKIKAQLLCEDGKAIQGMNDLGVFFNG